MMVIVQSLKSVTIQGLDILVKIRLVLIGLIAVSLGALFGYLIDSSEVGELIISIVVVLIVLVIIINNPLNGLLIWVFFTAFIETWINIPMGAGIPDLEFSRFVIIFLGISMLASAAIGKFHFARISLADVCIVATTIGIMIAAPLGRFPRSDLQSAVSLHFMPLVAYFFAKNLIKGKEDLHKLFQVLALFGFVAALYTIYEQATGHIFFVPKGVSVSDLERSAELYGHGIRAVQGFIGGNHLGRVFSATIPITFYLLFEGKKDGIWKVVLVGAIIIQSYGMFLTYNRTSWYGLLIGLFVIQFFYPQFRKLFVVITFVVVIGLWATWDQVNESTVVQERVNSKVSTLEGREYRWEAGYNMWLVKPIRGWGFDRFETESGRFRTDGYRKNFHAIENDYLHILVATGLIGFLPYLIFLVAILVNSVRLFFKTLAPDWSGFIRSQTIAILWGIILAFALGSYTQIQVQPMVKLVPFVVAGAVVGTHEPLLASLKRRKHSDNKIDN